MAGRFDLDREALAAVLAGEPRYRVEQVWDGIHAGRDPVDLTNLPRPLRERLAAEPALRPGLQVVHQREADRGTTLKWVFQVDGGHRIETVLMHYPDRSTACVSSQAGCAMACGFCATGQAGFGRNLSAGEIVEQVVRAAAAATASGRRLSNVVFMGMGEPLANHDRTWAAVERIHGDLGLSARHITVSTVGIVPGIHRLASASLPVTLAVSLHAADDDLRDRLVPINRRYPLADLLDACDAYRRAGGRRVTFEWALIDGVNDDDRQADLLAAAARRVGAHVNLIPLNPTPLYATPGSPPGRVRAFRGRLRAAGVNATVRRTRGADIDAACGQLAAGAARAGSG